MFLPSVTITTPAHPAGPRPQRLAGRVDLRRGHCRQRKGQRTKGKVMGLRMEDGFDRLAED
jgi:hypothetical protein